MGAKYTESLYKCTQHLVLQCPYFRLQLHCTIESKNMVRAIPEKNTWGGEEGRRYIFLWAVGAHIFQIIWVLGV